MNGKHFTINDSGCSIRCCLYGPETEKAERIVLYGHGFGGHKDNRAAMRYAEYAIPKHKGLAVLCFDWPCHGEDARKKLLLSDCDLYLTTLIAFARERFPEARLQAYATSFGGYLFLKYISEHDAVFERSAFRCPAVPMLDVMTHAIMRAEEAEKLAKGKDALVGFDRKIRISPDLLESLRENDLRLRDFAPYRNEILILHGTKDEIVPCAEVEAFAEKNGIPFFPVENADHRFIDPAKMHEAVALVEDFLE